jgi:hypothetical protein
MSYGIAVLVQGTKEYASFVSFFRTALLAIGEKQPNVISRVGGQLIRFRVSWDEYGDLKFNPVLFIYALQEPEE